MQLASKVFPRYNGYNRNAIHQHTFVAVIHPILQHLVKTMPEHVHFMIGDMSRLSLNYCGSYCTFTVIIFPSLGVRDCKTMQQSNLLVTMMWWTQGKATQSILLTKSSHVRNLALSSALHVAVPSLTKFERCK